MENRPWLSSFFALKLSHGEILIKSKSPKTRCAVRLSQRHVAWYKHHRKLKKQAHRIKTWLKHTVGRFTTQKGQWRRFFCWSKTIGMNRQAAWNKTTTQTSCLDVEKVLNPTNACIGLRKCSEKESHDSEKPTSKCLFRPWKSNGWPRLALIGEISIKLFKYSHPKPNWSESGFGRRFDTVYPLSPHRPTSNSAVLALFVFDCADPVRYWMFVPSSAHGVQICCRGYAKYWHGNSLPYCGLNRFRPPDSGLSIFSEEPLGRFFLD